MNTTHQSRRNDGQRSGSNHRGSSLTRSARTGSLVRFKDSSGKSVEGVALYFRSDYMIVGVQSTEKPQVWGITKRYVDADGFRRTVKGWIPNNSLHAVPFTSITETLINSNWTSA